MRGFIGTVARLTYHFCDTIYCLLKQIESASCTDKQLKTIAPGGVCIKTGRFAKRYIPAPGNILDNILEIPDVPDRWPETAGIYCLGSSHNHDIATLQRHLGYYFS
jgi:hypothetical protein